MTRPMIAVLLLLVLFAGGCQSEDQEEADKRLSQASDDGQLIALKPADGAGSSAGSASADVTLERLKADYAEAIEQCNEYTAEDKAECREHQDENATELIGLYAINPDPARLAKAFHLCATDPRFKDNTIGYEHVAYSITTACAALFFDRKNRMKEMMSEAELAAHAKERADRDAAKAAFFAIRTPDSPAAVKATVRKCMTIRDDMNRHDCLMNFAQAHQGNVLATFGKLSEDNYNALQNFRSRSIHQCDSEEFKYRKDVTEACVNDYLAAIPAISYAAVHLLPDALKVFDVMKHCGLHPANERLRKHHAEKYPAAVARCFDEILRSEGGWTE